MQFPSSTLKSLRFLKTSTSINPLSKNLSKKNFTNKELHFNAYGYRENESGIKVCFFGGNSSVANSFATTLLIKGTPVNLVHRNHFDAELAFSIKKLVKNSNPHRAHEANFMSFTSVNDNLKILRPYGKIGMKSFTHVPDYTNEWDLENAIRNCDVVINCVGPEFVIRKDEDFEEANVIIPRKIAKICAKLKNNPVKRFIHFSANGVNPESISKNLRTKWLGEQEVRDIYPEVTIIRPTEILQNRSTNNFMG